MKQTTVCLMFTIERGGETERADGLLTWAALVCLVLLGAALLPDRERTGHQLHKEKEEKEENALKHNSSVLKVCPRLLGLMELCSFWAC